MERITDWSPNPYLSVQTNWQRYKQAAQARGRAPSPEEFARAWWSGTPDSPQFCDGEPAR
ncbi:hypothetical protein [Tahibacter amnicola]|uniref:Uncharacterized protein n=1 Tax=Tahibacter amnicola TaxID=2976241 RepID=A0ABY6BAC1_9GAMM|nr:hypothetical protein [Tahibacter amnicola]UXI67008.1 hypothetical protein N4264_19975 [Tahibacter amnicola]